MEVGKTDVFEHLYMERFRALASRFGQFVKYERDRGARDIGLHFTHTKADGSAAVTQALVWFQMKGVMASTWPAPQSLHNEKYSLRMEMKHIRYWHWLPVPTYLVLYLESLNRFLVLDIQKYSHERWGDRVAAVKEQFTTVEIPLSYELDDTAFRQILANNVSSAWSERFAANSEHASAAFRCMDLIYRLGTRAERNVELEMRIFDWQSKLRCEFHFCERPSGSSDWIDVWSQWTHMGKAALAESHFPFLAIRPPPDQDDRDWMYEDDSDPFVFTERPLLKTESGTIRGTNRMDEYFEYTAAVDLNDLGRQMFDWIVMMQQADFVTIDLSKTSWLSLASWHARGV